ncbi:MAG: transglycosylase SLT domain-containing protein [Bdellovibrio sp.]|nr:transglycosylase SLT domain-containing protein [Bdellovibrio sp.]
MLEKSLYLCILAFFAACGGLKHLPPSEKRPDHPIEETWSKTFKLADELSKNGNMKDACIHWQHLSEQEEFPLKELAFIYHLYCLQSGPEIDQALAKFSPSRYLKKPYFETLSRSPVVKTERPLIHITSLEGLSALSIVKAEKIRYLGEALESAQKAGIELAVTRIQKKLESITPAALNNITEENYLEVAKNFIKEREYASARRYLERIIFKKQNDLDYLVEAWKIYAKTFKSEQDRDNYKLKLDALLRFLLREIKKTPSEKLDTISDFIHEVGFELARAEWTDEKDNRAIEILAILKKTQEKFLGRYKKEIDLLLGKIYLGENKLDKASDYFNKVTSANDIGDQTRADILHLMGFYHIQHEQWNVAPQYFEQALKLNITTIERYKFQFWLAKIKKVQGLDASDDFQKLFTVDSLGFYGIMSAIELGHSLPPLTALNLDNVILDEKFEWLLHFNLYSLADRYIDSAIPSKKNNSEQPLLLLARARQHHEVFYHLNKMNTSTYEQFINKYPSILLPTPFYEIFKKGSSVSEIEVELLLAIAKQESGFNEFAKSPADAYGLMQVIMPSAELAAKRANIKLTGPEDLYGPDINLVLGPTLFRQYLEEFDGRFPETIMAYNAGPIAAQRWQKKYFTPFCSDPINCFGKHRIDATLLLIEMVPYRETNAYVKKIFRNYFNYRRLLSPEPLSPDDLKAIFY